MAHLQLAIDTSASRPTAAILRGSELLHEWIGSKEEHHSTTLLAGIDTCFKKSGTRAQDLAFVSAGVGPGMFTGLRVGIATAKFFADLYDLPVAPVSSLLALALNAEEANHSRIWAMSDAKSQRVYALCVEKSKLGPQLSPEEKEEIALSPEEASSAMKPGDFLVGEGAEVFAQHWSSAVILAAPEAHAIRAYQVGRVGHAVFQEKKLVSATALSPRYLKTGQAYL